MKFIILLIITLLFSSTTKTVALESESEDDFYFSETENNIELLVNQLSHEENGMILTALTIIQGIIHAKNFNQTEKLLANGVLLKMPELLQHSDDAIVHHSLIFITKLIQTYKNHTITVLYANLFPFIIQNLEHKKLSIQEEATLTITSAITQGTPEVVSNLIDINVIQGLCKVLHRVEESRKMAQIVIIGVYIQFANKLENRIEEISEILDECGALKIFNRIKYDGKDEMISAFADEILKTYGGKSKKVYDSHVEL